MILQPALPTMVSIDFADQRNNQKKGIGIHWAMRTAASLSYLTQSLPLY